MDSHKFSVKESISIILLTIISIGTCLLMNLSMVYGFLLALFATGLLLNHYGASLEKIFQTLKDGIWACRSIYLVISLMGATIATWIASGVVPMLIYYGFIYIEGMNFLFACFVILMLLSYVMGTAIGTISTVGVALYGIGVGFGIPKEVIVGTLVSGAFIADKISPMSGLMNLTLETVGGSYKPYLKEQFKTLSVGIVISLVFYYILGSQYSGGHLGAEVTLFSDGVSQLFSLSPFLLLFPIMVVFLALGGVTTIRMMSLCVVFGSGVALLYQQVPVLTMVEWLWNGVALNSGIEVVDNIIKGGGVRPMIEVILIVMSAVALSSLFELGGVFEPLINVLIGDSLDQGKLIRRTAILSLVLTSITCDQTVGIIVPGKQLKKRYLEAGLTEVQLASVISDSGTIIAPVEFWNVNALILMAIFSMNPIQYVPYAVLCYGMPLIVIARGFMMGLGNKENGVKSYE
jgi:NhaC family Na+:H+ antiporter